MQDEQPVIDKTTRVVEGVRFDANKGGTCNRDLRIAGNCRRQGLHTTHHQANTVSTPERKCSPNKHPPVNPGAHLQSVIAVDAADDTELACAKRFERKGTNKNGMQRFDV